MPDLPEMKGADVPPQIVEAARRGYSMHGAGLVANLIAAAWREIERQVRAEVAAEIEAAAGKCSVHEVDGMYAAAEVARGDQP